MSAQDSAQDGQLDLTQFVEPCPLCGDDISDTPLHKHLPKCDDPEGDYHDA